MMKKLIFCVVVIICAIIDCNAANVYNLVSHVYTDKDSPEKPKFEIVSNGDSYSVVYTVEEIALWDDDVYLGKKFIYIPGFVQSAECGKPSFPIHHELFQVPEGTKPIVTLEDSSYVDVSVALAPGRNPLFDSAGEYYTKDNVPNIELYSGYSDNELLTIGETHRYRGIPIVSIGICPVHYSLELNNVRVYTRLKFKISFEAISESQRIETASQIRYNNKKENATFANMHLLELLTDSWSSTEYDITSVFNTSEDDAEDMLIVTTPEFETAIETFIDWKRRDGYNCFVLSDDSWTPQFLKSEILSFAESHPDFTTLLIIGNIESVPAYGFDTPSFAKHQYGTDYYYSDFYYACLDGDDDLVPDIDYGRIPANDIDEVVSSIAKIIQYETLSGYTPLRYDMSIIKGVHAAFFETSSYNTHTSRTFIHTSETIRSSLLNRGMDIARIYSKPADATPMYYSNGTPLPDDIKYPAFPWDGTENDIHSEINSGVNYVLYRGHGNWSLWGNPTLYASNLYKLQNTYWFPVIFSISCLTGRMDTNSLARQFMVIENKGASGVLSASNLSYSSYNDLLAIAIFNAIYPDAKLLDSSGTTIPGNITIGTAVRNGLLYMSSMGYNKDYIKYQNEIYYWFGDPSMRMYTNRPEPIYNVGISYAANYTAVEVKDSNVKLTAVYDDGHVISYKRASAKFPTVGCKSVTVTGANKIPRTITWGENEAPKQTDFSSYLQSAFCRGGELVVNYYLSQTTSTGSAISLPSLSQGVLVITGFNGTVVGSYPCPVNQTQVKISLSGVAFGTYTVTLRQGANICGSTTIYHTENNNSRL